MKTKNFIVCVFCCVFASVLSARAAVMLENFESYTAGQVPPTSNWYISNGVGVPIVTSSGPVGDGTKSFLSDYSQATDYYEGLSGTDDGYQSWSWGPVFKLTNATGSITYKLYGGNHTNLTPTDRREGATGVALWNVTDGTLVASTFSARTSVGNDFSETKSIALSGLTVGKTYAVVVIDQHTGTGGTWGKTGVDQIEAPDHTVQLATGTHHTIYRAYEFDTTGNFEGWTGASNFGLKGNSFEAIRWVDLDNSFSSDHGYLTSAIGGDGPTGTFTSPTFTLQGDIIEFRIAGGKGGASALKGTGSNSASLGLELVNAADNSVLRWAVGQDLNEFTYDLWEVKDLIGTSVYLRVRDDATGGWGKLHVDSIREVGFFEIQDLSVIPEPSTIFLLGVGGWLLYRRFRHNR